MYLIKAVDLRHRTFELGPVALDLQVLLQDHWFSERQPLQDGVLLHGGQQFLVDDFFQTFVGLDAPLVVELSKTLYLWVDLVLLLDDLGFLIGALLCDGFLGCFILILHLLLDTHLHGFA